MSRIAILGSGAWGTALAISLANRPGHQVTLWSHSTVACEAIRQSHENRRYLPGSPLPDSLQLTADPGHAIREAEVLVTAIPSEHLRATLQRFAPHLHSGQILVSATKGLEHQTLYRMTELIHDTLRSPEISIGALSGPSFAHEVAAGAPTALTIAFSRPEIASRIQADFTSPTLRLYTNDDLIGVELGGALKNVIAIAAGVVTGLRLGHNTAAALITRGIAEITRLAVACGGRRETLAGLSGLGDLVLTCTGALSRNRTVGIELGRGRQLPDILAALQGKVAEGVRTTFAARDLARKHGIEMPITEQMAAILGEAKPPLKAMKELMSRPGRDE